MAGLESYGAVLVGGPMIVGWHRRALSFVHKRQKELSRVPVAYFMTAMELTKDRDNSMGGLEIYQDSSLVRSPLDAQKLNFKEKHSTVAHYLKPVLRKAGLIKPIAIAFFAGKLDYGKLRFFQKLFVMLIIRANGGDRRNWEAIRAWAAGLSDVLLDPSKEKEV